MKRIVLNLFIVLALGFSTLTLTGSNAYAADDEADKPGVKSGLDFLTKEYDTDAFKAIGEETKAIGASGFNLVRTIILILLTFSFMGIIIMIFSKKSGQDLTDIKFTFGKFVLGCIMFYGMFKILDIIAAVALGL